MVVVILIMIMIMVMMMRLLMMIDCMKKGHCGQAAHYHLIKMIVKKIMIVKITVLMMMIMIIK